LIIIDENIDRKVNQSLIDFGFEVLSIKENSRGISDKEIINIAKSTKGIILSKPIFCLFFWDKSNGKSFGKIRKNVANQSIPCGE